MTQQTQTPNLPKTGDTPAIRQLLAGLDQFVRALLRTHVFLTRQAIEAPLQARSGDTEMRPLKWGVMNRLAGLATANLTLPPILPQYVGVPLYFTREIGATGGAGDTYVYPSGYALDRKTRPQVNATTFVNLQEARLYVFMTDGVNWWVNEG